MKTLSLNLSIKTQDDYITVWPLCSVGIKRNAIFSIYNNFAVFSSSIRYQFSDEQSNYSRTMQSTDNKQ